MIIKLWFTIHFDSTQNNTNTIVATLYSTFYINADEDPQVKYKFFYLDSQLIQETLMAMLSNIHSSVVGLGKFFFVSLDSRFILEFQG